MKETKIIVATESIGLETTNLVIVLEVEQGVDIEKAIKKRAKPVEERAAKPEKTEVHKKLSIETLSNEAKIVYNQLNKPIFYPDEINNTSLEPGDILSALTELEIEGLIRSLPGGRYELIKN